MRIAFWVLLSAVALASAGCNDQTAPRDVTPPAAPRGVRSITGDHQVVLSWYGNTEPDVTGYRIYWSTCANCPYDYVGQTSTNTFTVTGLTNGVTRFYAVSAVDRAGNASELSYENVFDTPRPAGFGAQLGNYLNDTAGAGWDFSATIALDAGAPATDMFYGHNGSVAQMFVPDFGTDIQDAGYAQTLDAVDYSPDGGWSPSGSVELIPGHCYVVWTRDNHFAKFRVTALTTQAVTFDWAYQTAAGNRELRSRPARTGGTGRRPIEWIR